MWLLTVRDPFSPFSRERVGVRAILHHGQACGVCKTTVAATLTVATFNRYRRRLCTKCAC